MAITDKIVYLAAKLHYDKEKSWILRRFNAVCRMLDLRIYESSEEADRLLNSLSWLSDKAREFNEKTERVRQYNPRAINKPINIRELEDYAAYLAIRSEDEYFYT